MKQKLVITKQKNNYIVALTDAKRLIEVQAEPSNQTIFVGNIYVGQVKNIVHNINAAFVQVDKNTLCYYSLEENKHHLFLNKKAGDELKPGDLILVQISREAVKNKAPTCTCYLNFTGRYSVLTWNKTIVGFSNKITSQERRKELKALYKPFKNPNYGFIVRTNAAEASDDEIVSELEVLIERAEKIIQEAPHRNYGQVLMRGLPGYLTVMRDYSAMDIKEILTDDQEIYEQLMEQSKQSDTNDVFPIRLYNDPYLSLDKLYRITTQMEEALKTKVWLKSGGYLFIEPTEAMTVIDVNTGKAIEGKRPTSKQFYKINLEAAKEIAYQIRLRNLSGIIIIDFIDMVEPERKEELLNEFEKFIRQDRIKTTLVDITSLGLVELTRKKIKKPLYEQLTKECESYV